MSFGTCFPPKQLSRVRAVFRVRWSGFLRSSFNADPVLIAYFFDVTERTSRNWLDQICDPSAFAVARAEAAFPGTSKMLVAA